MSIPILADVGYRVGSINASTKTVVFAQLITKSVCSQLVLKANLTLTLIPRPNSDLMIMLTLTLTVESA